MLWISYIAHPHDAHHSVCANVQEQAPQEAPSFLLGGLPKVRREWEAEAGDDSRCVCPRSLPNERLLNTRSSNAIRNDLVRVAINDFRLLLTCMDV